MDLVSIVITRDNRANTPLEVVSAQTIEDCKRIDAATPREALELSGAPVFLFPRGRSLHPQSAEFAALAVWGGNDRLSLPDGSTVYSRRALSALKGFEELNPIEANRPAISAFQPLPGLEKLHQHLEDSGLLADDAWRKHPVRSAVRLIPLRIKEHMNRLAGRPIFNLDFYLQFQPRSVSCADGQRALLKYTPKRSARRRIALITPHLGPGGAEHVLLEIASALDRNCCEIFLIATQSADSRWKDRWRMKVDRLYDLASLVNPELTAAAVDSVVRNWDIKTVVLQNSLSAYSLIPHWKRDLPAMKVMDLIHAVGGDWDVPSATAEIARALDLRIVESQQARIRLEHLGVDPARIRLVRHGVDLEHFKPAPAPEGDIHRILFVGRLDPVKRPLLLVEIARALLGYRPQGDFRIAIVGTGPESAALAAAVERSGMERAFELLGDVPDVAPFLARSDLVVITSKNEGIPLVLLEAFASGRPVVSSRVGAIEEVLDERTGRMIEPGPDEGQAFAHAIAGLLSERELRAKMGAAGRARVEAQFDRNRSRELYSKLLA